MATFSAIDLKSRFEIQDLLSRFCHSLDRNDAQEWINLFHADSSVTAPRLGTFVGLEAITMIPQMVQDFGGGCWRHYLNNMAMKPLEHGRAVQVDAYCMVSNWKAGGQIIRSWDLRAIVTGARRWRIRSLCLNPVEVSRESRKSDLANDLADPTANCPTRRPASFRHRSPGWFP